MDIQHLVDRLDQLLNESTRLPLSAYLLVNEDKIFNLIDQMRVAIPEEIKRANRIEADKDRILAQAHEEAERIRGLAKQEANELVKRDSITQSSQQRADNILERARRDADALRQDADGYVMEVLTKLEEDLLRSLAVVRNGLNKVHKDGTVSSEQ
jgi:cell division septum initiation protein DivIVA